MSSLSLVGGFLTTHERTLAAGAAQLVSDPGAVVTASRRKPDRLQGRSLEALDHAIEYLIERQMFETEPGPWHSDGEAVQVLSELSRQVFLECPVFVSMRDRISASFDRTISTGWYHV